MNVGMYGFRATAQDFTECSKTSDLYRSSVAFDSKWDTPQNIKTYGISKY